MVLNFKLSVITLGIFFLSVFTATAEFSLEFPHGMPFPATRMLPATEETADAASLQKEEVLIQLNEAHYYQQDTHYTVVCNKKMQKYQFRIIFLSQDDNDRELYPNDVVIKVNGKLVQPQIVTQKSPAFDKNGDFIGYLTFSQYYRRCTFFTFDVVPASETEPIAIEVVYSNVTEDETSLIRYGEPDINEKVLPLVQWKNDPIFSLEIYSQENEDLNKNAWVINICFPLKNTTGMDEDEIREQENTLWLFAEKNVLNNDLFEITKTKENGIKFDFTNKFSKLYQQNFQMITASQLDQRGNDENYNRFQIVPFAEDKESQKYISPYLVKLNLRTKYKNNCYSEHKLNPYELILYTPRQLRYVRNAFYAAHGYQFKSKDLQDFFEYTGHAPANPNFTESEFSDIEKYNIKMIQQMEDFYNK